VPNADSPDKHDFDQVNHPGAAALIGYILVADELASAVFAEVMLFAVAFFPFRDMVGIWQRGHEISMVIGIIS
jgi:hypothetical protein